MSLARTDLRGMRFGSWLVKRDLAHDGPLGNKRHALCVCDCGSERMVQVRNLLAGLTSNCKVRGCKERRNAEATC